MVTDRRTDRITLGLRGVTVTGAQARAELRAKPIEGLREVITSTDAGLGRAFP